MSEVMQAGPRLFHHPELPKIDLCGNVWVLDGGQEADCITLERVEDLVEEEDGLKTKIHIFGHPRFTYYRVFGEDHGKLLF